MTPIKHEQVQQIVHQDVPAVAVGGAMTVYACIADMATLAQQLSMIFGCVLVFLTVIHRLILIKKDWKKRR